MGALEQKMLFFIWSALHEPASMIVMYATVYPRWQLRSHLHGLRSPIVRAPWGDGTWNLVRPCRLISCVLPPPPLPRSDKQWNSPSRSRFHSLSPSASLSLSPPSVSQSLSLPLLDYWWEVTRFPAEDSVAPRLTKLGPLTPRHSGGYYDYHTP